MPRRPANENRPSWPDLESIGTDAEDREDVFGFFVSDDDGSDEWFPGEGEA